MHVVCLFVFFSRNVTKKIAELFQIVNWNTKRGFKFPSWFEMEWCGVNTTGMPLLDCYFSAKMSISMPMCPCDDWIHVGFGIVAEFSVYP